jgi:hypothetical protein
MLMRHAGINSRRSSQQARQFRAFQFNAAVLINILSGGA